MTAPRSPDTPSVSPRDDRLEIIGRRSLAPGAGTHLGDLVLDTVAAMNRSGEDAEQIYQRHLDQLREGAGDAISEVRAQYDALDEEQYVERWSLIQLLTDLRDPASLPVLEHVLRQPVPPERSPDPAHGLSTVGEEIMIRTTAVEALARLAADGADEAKRLLLEQLDHEAFSVRRAAVQAIADSGDAGLRDRVQSRLSESDDQRLLNSRRLDVTSVPQAEGGRFLKGRDAASPPPPPN